MNRKILVVAAALCLAACGPVTAPGDAAPATSQVTSFERRYQDIRLFADLLLPLLPDARAAQIRAAAERVDRALALLRAAAVLGDRLAAAREVERSLADLSAVTGG